MNLYSARPGISFTSLSLVKTLVFGFCFTEMRFPALLCNNVPSKQCIMGSHLSRPAFANPDILRIHYSEGLTNSFCCPHSCLAICSGDRNWPRTYYRHCSVWISALWKQQGDTRVHSWQENGLEMKLLAGLIRDVMPAGRPQLSPYAYAPFLPLCNYSSAFLYKHEQTLL